MQLSDFQYDLPDRLIAQYPMQERTGARLLQVLDEGARHGTFLDIKGLLREGDLLVTNNTRVIKARLHALKDSGGQAEVMLERITTPREALCQVRVSKPLKVGRSLSVAGERLHCVGREGQFYRLASERAFLDVLDEHGHVPLPPYISRADEAGHDGERYQTVYSSVPGAVAAPTAGLHFTDALLDDLRGQGVATAEVTLHVGAGTFQPVRGDIDQHQMHHEWYQVDEQAAEAIARTKSSGGRIVAVGTTVVRTLESAVQQGRVRATAAETNLFIKPGFQFDVVDALITNFHLPGSTLIMLVCAFAGYDRVMAAYREAVSEEYRFFSYGDAMWLERAHV